MNKSKTKIVITSVLKPVDDVRNYKKIATSLSVNENYEITVLGTQAHSPWIVDQIISKHWSKFERLSFQRLKVQGVFWEILKDIKPDLIICTTFELLLVSVLFRIRYRAKIIYDIQEDYLKNLWYQKFYPFGLRHMIGLTIRALELVLSPFISGFTLAEKTYKNDIYFARSKSLILENKSLPISRKKNDDNFNVIFTGTISSYSRTLESIKLYLQIQEQLLNSTLSVIGYCPSHSYQKLLESHYSTRPEIELKLSSYPVPHTDIVQQISTANLAIIGYSANPVNERKIPTKLYEYTAAKLPYLVQASTHWAQMGLQLGGAIPIDFNQPNSVDILLKIAEMSSAKFAESGFQWEEQEDELSEFIQFILH